MYRLKFSNNWGPCIFGSSFGTYSERADYLLRGRRNDAGITREISAVLSSKCFLRIIEISHLNI